MSDGSTVVQVQFPFEIELEVQWITLLDIGHLVLSSCIAVRWIPSKDCVTIEIHYKLIIIQIKDIMIDNAIVDSLEIEVQ